MNMESETYDGWLIFVGQVCNKPLQLIGFVDILHKGEDILNDIVAKSYLYLENTYKKLNARECAKSVDQQYHTSSLGLDLAAKSVKKGREVFALFAGKTQLVFLWHLRNALLRF